MPIIPGPGASSPPTTCRGMTRSDILELANQLTERRGEKVLNLKLLFAHVLQDFCGRNRFWWRNYYATFQTVIGQQDYDMTDGTTFSPDLSEIDVEELTQVGLIQAGQGQPVTYLEPIFDPRTLVEMKQGLNSSGTSAPSIPGRYTVDAGGSGILLIDSPNGAYNMAITFWAMPAPKSDSVSDCVPLVPPQHHKALVAGMESKIWKRVEGIGSKQYLSAKEEYEEAIMLAQARPRFTTNYSQQLIQSESAIRST